MDKYYIPKIEEFYIGFLYERKNGDDWEEAEFGVNDCIGTLAKGYENEFEEILKGLRDVRVKYLTKEQIANEPGFTIEQGEFDLYEGRNYVHRISYENSFVGEFYTDKTVHLGCNIEFFNTFFTIPSINEFRKICKYLNIT